MSRTTSTFLIAALASLAVVATPAWAGTIDQQQTQAFQASGGVGLFPDGRNFSRAQTFTAGRSGYLDQVDLALGIGKNQPVPTTPLTIEVRNASGGVPGSTVLATASVAGTSVAAPGDVAFRPIPLAAAPAVTAGTQYAIVAYVDAPVAYNWVTRLNNPYPGGDSLFNRSLPWSTWGVEFLGGVRGDRLFKTYVAEWNFTGFFSPVNNPGDPAGSNSVKAGASVPVKFSLGGSQGLDVLADGYPKLAFTACEAKDAPDPVEETSTSNSGLKYDAASDTYSYVWKTEKSWKGRCGTFTLKLDDASVHTADFKFK